MGASSRKILSGRFGALLDRLCEAVGGKVKANSGKLWIYAAADAAAAESDAVRADLSELSSAEITVSRADQYGAVSARWHDVETARVYTEKAGEGTPCKELPNEYASAAEALSAAKAELARIKENARECTLKGAAIMDVMTERKLVVDGKFSPFAGMTWRVTQAIFRLTPSGGLTMEARLKN